MEANKTILVRRHVLGLLEQGKLKANDQVPSARDLSVELGISFLKVQQAIESLCQDGVMEALPRKGTYVQKNWQDRVLPENVSVYNQLHRLPWLDGLMHVAEKEIPGLRTTYAFKRGMLELRTTRHVLTEHNEYMDLSEVFNECYPDHSVFFEKPFQPFFVDGRIIGIPFAFSPRVVFFNRELFRKAGCRIPETGWTWEEFIDCIARLKKILPADRIINWHHHSYLWMNFLIRAGGRLFSPLQDDPVTVDSPRTLRGLQYFTEVGDMIGRPEYDDDGFHKAFLTGGAAMMVAGRQYLDFAERSGFEEWATAPLPRIPGGEDSTAQATDLVCVRKSCTSRNLAMKFVRMMLSESVQDYIAARKFSIPIRKSSAYKTLDLTSPRDALFAVEMGKVSTDFNLAPPFPGSLVVTGIERLLLHNLDLPSGLAELGQVARTYMGIHGRIKKGSNVKSVFATASEGSFSPELCLL